MFKPVISVDIIIRFPFKDTGREQLVRIERIVRDMMNGSVKYIGVIPKANAVFRITIDSATSPFFSSWEGGATEADALQELKFLIQEALES